MTLRAVLVDDEQHCTETLELLLRRHCPDISIVAVFHKAEDVLDKLPELNPDILFLDINMPRLNGFQLLDSLQGRQPEVIFTTAHDEHAVQAFRVGAADYLMKPVRANDLTQAIDRVKQRLDKKSSLSDTNEVVPAGMTVAMQHGRIPLKSVHGIEMINAEEVLYCESQSNYTLLYTDQEKHLITRTLKEMEDQLKPYGFIRVHNSYLVNFSRIQKYVKGDGGYIVMSNGASLNVSKSRRKALLQAMEQGNAGPFTK